MNVTDNLAVWSTSYDWKHGGEEWSLAWGGSEAQWFGTILPRIHRHIPAGTILEIAPGFGRWTRFLRGFCRRLVGVDLSTQCIDHCRQHFRGESALEFFVNDGMSLDMVPDGSVDFVFSFDSLVHAESDVLESYTRQLATKLSPDGVGFIHHSNLGAYAEPLQAGAVENLHARAPSMSAPKFRQYCDLAGLSCTAQEILNWGQAELVDCLSTFVLAGSPLARETRIHSNPRFMLEADLIRDTAPLYCSGAADQLD